MQQQQQQQLTDSRHLQPPIVDEMKQQPPMPPMSPTSATLLTLLLLSVLAQPITGLSATTGGQEATQRLTGDDIVVNSSPPDSSSHTLRATTAATAIHPSSAAINRCRDGCLAQCWSRCPDTPMEEEKAIPAAVRFTPHCQLQLTVQRLVRNESLVLAEISWKRTVAACGPGPAPLGDQCLVTWEVSGGGLMGNLLTEATSNAQLSLWTDTLYRVQVTCRDKHTSSLVRSASLQLNTSAVTVAQPFDQHPASRSRLTEIADGDDDEALTARIEAHDRRALDHRPVSSPSPSSGSRELLLLGVFVALLLCLLLLLVSVRSVVRWRPGRTADRDQITDRHALVENELLVDILHV
ncbi:transmembrane protein fend-like isoform X2 [Anopheles albimanus]|uniref:transmembrane protein fend-like isoform X2 n=1 Tax=Anopheles albimanus TaxID=7167 RepID=UPI00164077EF|nr:transmembrane protein fend-like isoform X2 [Anopheles albimanus]